MPNNNSTNENNTLNNILESNVDNSTLTELDDNFEDIDLNDTNQINHDITCSQREVFNCNECQLNKCLCQIIHYPTYGEICLNCKEEKGEIITRRSSFVSYYSESNFTNQFSTNDQFILETMKGLETVIQQRIDGLEVKFLEKQTDSGYSSGNELAGLKTEGAKSKEFNIYNCNTLWHVPIWTCLTFTSSTLIYFFFSKRKDEKNKLKSKFTEWIKNIVFAITGLSLSFILVTQFISKFIAPNMSEWLTKDNKKWATLITAIVSWILGLVFIADGKISAALKTPLQRFSIQIENSNFSEKKKKLLLSKSQEANEMTKETLKKFGVLVVPDILGNLLGANKQSLVYYSCYLCPLLLTGKLAWDIWNQLEDDETTTSD
jgi:hypothetical protein